MDNEKREGLEPEVEVQPKENEAEVEVEAEAEPEVEAEANTEAEVKTPEEKKKKKKVILLIILSIFLIFVIIAAAFINHKLGLINYGTGLDYTLNTNDNANHEDETVDFGEIGDATGHDYKEILKNWAINSDAQKLQSKEVVNILLIGSDASAEDPYRSDIMENGNTDVMMLVSVNTEKKTIKLVSFMRDSYTYLKGYDKFSKLNAACSKGGPAYLVDVIEDDYKIEIDGYVMVDFDTFTKCIDIVGGVNVDVPTVVGQKLGIPYGENVSLDGAQALEFCRVRKLYADGDVSRTANQRMVVNALISKCKSASPSKINSVLDVVLANVHTSLRKKEVITYMTKALSDGWASFTVTQRTMPTADARYGYSGSAWIWVVDYPLAAQKLQTELYGTTNIKLEEHRTTAITIMGGYVTEDKGN